MFFSTCNTVMPKTPHAWPDDDLALASVRDTYSTELCNSPRGRNILQRKRRCHEKAASTTVNTITAYKLSVIFSKQQSANGTAVLRNNLLKRTLCSSKRQRRNVLTFLDFLLVPVSTMTGTTESELTVPVMQCEYADHEGPAYMA